MWARLLDKDLPSLHQHLLLSGLLVTAVVVATAGPHLCNREARKLGHEHLLNSQ
jgi:hypothetical protein